MVEEKYAPPILTRLIDLVAAGYVIDTRASTTIGDAVWLDHPATRRAAQPTVLLLQDGCVVGIDGPAVSHKQLRIGPNETDAFRSFVQRVPKPTWWERNNTSVYTLGAWAVLLAIGFAIYQVLDVAWRALKGTV